MKKLLWIMVPLALVLSCKSKSEQPFDGTVVEKFPKVIELSNPRIIDKYSAYYNIYAADTLLIAQAVIENPRGTLFILDPFSGKNLGPVTFKGRGPNEFLRMYMEPSDWRNELDGMKIWGYDTYNWRYVKINLTRRILENQVYIEEEITFPEGIASVERLSDVEFFLTTNSNIETKKKERALYLQPSLRRKRSIRSD